MTQNDKKKTPEHMPEREDAIVPRGRGEILLYQTDDGRARVECWFEDKTVWLSQALMAELFQKDVRTINEHLMNIFNEEELNPEATIRKFRVVRQEGNRQVTREIDQYSLDAIRVVFQKAGSTNGVVKTNAGQILHQPGIEDIKSL